MHQEDSERLFIAVFALITGVMFLRFALDAQSEAQGACLTKLPFLRWRRRKSDAMRQDHTQ